MTPQPEALRLAYWLDGSSNGPMDARHKAATELRRLHGELQATERQVEILSDDLSRCSKLNAELLLALKRIGGRCDVEPAYKIARAAIAKAGEAK